MFRKLLYILFFVKTQSVSLDFVTTLNVTHKGRSIFSPHTCHQITSPTPTRDSRDLARPEIPRSFLYISRIRANRSLLMLRIFSQLEPNNRKCLTCFGCQTLRYNETGRQENKNVFQPKWLLVVDPKQENPEFRIDCNRRETMREFKVTISITDFQN